MARPTVAKWVLGEDSEQFDKTPVKTLKQQNKDALKKQAEAEADRIGVGVTTEEQEIFDALAKMFPCEWVPGPPSKPPDKPSILVMTDIRINHPYESENVMACAWAQSTVTARIARVSQVLETKAFLAAYSKRARLRMYSGI